MRFPVAYCKTFRARPPASWWSASGSTSSASRCSAPRPSRSSACRARITAAWSMRGCKGGLDFMKDDENINSQPFMHWRDRFLYCMEAINKADRRDRRDQGPLSQHHRRNDGGDVPARRVRQGTRLPSSWSTISSSAGRRSSRSVNGAGERHDPAHAPRRPRHLHVARSHGISFRVIAKMAPAFAGVDHLHCGTAVGKLEGDPLTVQGYYNLCATRPANEVDLHAASSSTRTGPTCKKVMPVASGGIHAGQMHQLLDLFGDDVVLQFGGGTHRPPDGHPGGSNGQPGCARGDGAGPQRGPRHRRMRGRTSFGLPPGGASRWKLRSRPGATSPSTTHRQTRRTSCRPRRSPCKPRSRRTQTCVSPKAAFPFCPT
jgi:ribulose-bisphosphate carboxylase large chain